jgi:hypothetical protein
LIWLHLDQLWLSCWSFCAEKLGLSPVGTFARLLRAPSTLCSLSSAHRGAASPLWLSLDQLLASCWSLCADLPGPLPRAGRQPHANTFSGPSGLRKPLWNQQNQLWCDLDHWKHVGGLLWHRSYELIEISCRFFISMIRVGVQIRRAGPLGVNLNFLAHVLLGFATARCTAPLFRRNPLIERWHGQTKNVKILRERARFPSLGDGSLSRGSFHHDGARKEESAPPPFISSATHLSHIAFETERFRKFASRREFKLKKSMEKVTLTRTDRRL